LGHSSAGHLLACFYERWQFLRFLGLKKAEALPEQ
jgi:hypothetical protein